MITQDIYNKYNIPPHLQLHMLRVAGVVKLICKHREGEDLPVHDLLSVALIHDMGNIIKFDIDLYPEFREPEWVDYRKEVQVQFQQYGNNEYEATKYIAKQCGISTGALDILHLFDTYDDDKLLESKNILLWIMDYADSRVWMLSIQTTVERISTQVERNMKNKWRSKTKAEEVAENRTATASFMEKWIFKHCSIKPSDINDWTIDPLLEELRHYNIIVEK